MSEKKLKLKLYADGACSGNPGPGAYAAIMVCGSTEKIFNRAFVLTTNNRMELLGVIEPMEDFDFPCEIEVWTDSQYIVNAINKKWLESWVKKGWKKADNKPVLNIDLWERMLKVLNRHTIKFNWIKGHSKHPQNERCDQMAVNNILVGDKMHDEIYEESRR